MMEQSVVSSESKKVSLEDFTLIRVIGKGSYGKVMLVRHKRDGAVYAMKTLRKENVVKRNQIEFTKTERNVLGSTSHPFIVQLFYAFQTPKKLYFILEFCAGGELFFHLSRAGRFSEARCRFYAQEIVLALEYLHRKDIVFRELKPENCVLDADGHIRITDFGLSKEGVTDTVQTRNMCGTPEYLAPEILEKQPHGKAVDWYTLGALCYEMLTGLPPFYTKDRDKLFERIRKADLPYPSYLTPEARSLLEALQQRDPIRRLGAGMADAQEVMNHPFFAGTDWTAVYEKRYVPPFKPTLTSDTDVQYFDKEFVSLPVINSLEPHAGETIRLLQSVSSPAAQSLLSPPPSGGGDSSTDIHFEGFTYQSVPKLAPHQK
jgi:protein-serine/threonine kinase